MQLSKENVKLAQGIVLGIVLMVVLRCNTVAWWFSISSGAVLFGLVWRLGDHIAALVEYTSKWFEGFKKERPNFVSRLLGLIIPIIIALPLIAGYAMGLYPEWTRICASVLMVIAASNLFGFTKNIEAWLGRMFRPVPVLTSCVLIGLGGAIYWLWVAYVRVIPNIENTLPNKIEWPVFIGIVLAPYFFVLWVWRHNNTEEANARAKADKEYRDKEDKKREERERRDHLNQIFGWIQSGAGENRVCGLKVLHQICEEKTYPQELLIEYLDYTLVLISEIGKLPKECALAANTLHQDYKMITKHFHAHKYSLPVSIYELPTISNAKITTWNSSEKRFLSPTTFHDCNFEVCLEELAKMKNLTANKEEQAVSITSSPEWRARYAEYWFVLRLFMSEHKFFNCHIPYRSNLENTEELKQIIGDTPGITIVNSQPS